MLIRLNIPLTGSDQTVTYIVVEYPDVDTLNVHLHYPAKEGYRLYEVLGVLVPNMRAKVDICCIEISEVLCTDTVLRRDVLKNYPY